MKHTQSSGLWFCCVLGVIASACADPEAQPEVSVTVTGLTMTTTGRNVTVGDVGIELNFVPTGSTGGARPHRRLVLYEGGDAQSLRVQVPAGAYTVTARVSTFLSCSLTPREVQLGASTSSITVTIPTTASDAGAAPTLAISPTTISNPCS